MHQYSDLHKVLGDGFSMSKRGKKDEAVAMVKQALVKDADLLHNARQRKSEIELFLTLGRKCHCTEVYLELLTEALEGIPNG